MATRILLRRDTSANWASANTVLANGEIGYDTTLDRIKVGDGSTAWASLPFTTNVDIANNSNAGLLSASDYAELSGATTNNTASKIVKRDASGNFSVNLISASGTPSSASHLTTKSYVDALVNETVVPVTLTTNVGTMVWTDGNIFYIATAPSAAMTFNITSVPTTNNRIMTVKVFVTQGATGYIPSTFQIDGASQTIKWTGGSAPTPTSSAGKIDIFSFTMQRSSAAWIVYGSATLNH